MAKRIRAVASGGGQRPQLQLMRLEFVGHEVLFLTTMPGLPEQFDAQPSGVLPDSNREQEAAILPCSTPCTGTEGFCAITEMPPTTRDVQ